MPLPHRPVAAVLLGLPAAAEAHSFGQLYNLPVPLWLYLWASAAALLLSFVVAVWFLRASASQGTPVERDVSVRLGRLLHPVTLSVLRLLALATLALCIATGLWGSPNPYVNFNMTLFWIVFLLGCGWLAALLGDWYALLNPWRTLSGLIARVWPRAGQGFWRVPACLGLWPALLLYMAFIWFELFGHCDPRRLALLLAGYTVFNLVGAMAVGLRDWYGRCEFLSVWFRLVALIAPVVVREAAGRARVSVRAPGAGLLARVQQGQGEVLFVLFMLSSTAYDGLHETLPWLRLFWGDVFALLQPWFGDNAYVAYPRLQPYFQRWQMAALFWWPLVYYAVYRGFIGLTRVAAGKGPDAAELSLRFAYSLLPIALVYHVTHYWTLLLTQGVKIVALASDPFGTGADWFGTADWFARTIIPDMGLVWHTQVGLIVLGHVASVVAAHAVALRIYGRPIVAARSQLPMLALMMAFTAAGLWILAQPLEAAVR